MARAEIGFILEMAADDPAFEDANAINRIEAAGLPVAGVRASANAGIAIFGHLHDIVGIPDAVARIVRTTGVIMDADPDIELLHERFDDVELPGILGGHAIEAELFGELEDFPPFRLVLASHHTVIDGLDAVLLELGLHLGEDLLTGVVTERYLGIFFREFLAGEKLDDFAAGFGGF